MWIYLFLTNQFACTSYKISCLSPKVKNEKEVSKTMCLQDSHKNRPGLIASHCICIQCMERFCNFSRALFCRAFSFLLTGTQIMTFHGSCKWNRFVRKKDRIDDSAKDGGPHFTQCMIGICPLVTHSYQNLQLQHKILTAATIDLGHRNFIAKSILS